MKFADVGGLLSIKARAISIILEVSAIAEIIQKQTPNKKSHDCNVDNSNAKYAVNPSFPTSERAELCLSIFELLVNVKIIHTLKLKL